MKQPSSTRVLLACAAVAILALWSAVTFYESTAAAVAPDADVYKVGDQRARLGELSAALPATGVVGYVSDASPAETLGAALYSSAQYTLAPRLVTGQPAQPPAEWVLGDFSKPLDMAEFGKQHGLVLVKDFGNGAVLYRSKSR
jgi:hypothetical protein